MRRSLNELETLLRKAALGAGLSLGLAEDVARAGVWLTIHGWDGAGAVLHGLRAKPSLVQPKRRGDGYVFNGAHAVTHGPAALDLLLASPSNERCKLFDVDVPLLVLGLAGVVAQSHRISLRVEFNTGVARLGPAGMQLHDATPMFGDSITIVRSADGPFEPQKILALSGAEVGDAIWEQISELAVKTYVPSNQVSRARGAGAGLTDND